MNEFRLNSKFNERVCYYTVNTHILPYTTRLLDGRELVTSLINKCRIFNSHQEVNNFF